MEIKIKKNDLLKGLSLIQGIVEKKTTMPILANVLLQAQAKDFTIIATDLEVGLNTKINADIITEGKIAVHAKGLYDIVRALPDDMVHLKVGENYKIDIKCGRSQFKIVGLSSEEFPKLPKKGEGTGIKVESNIIKQMLEKTAFAMSNDEMRLNLNGVYVEQEGPEILRMVAIDGHRLSIVNREIKGEWKLPKGVIIPRKGVMEFRKIVEAAEGTIDIWFDNKHVILGCDNSTLVIRLLDGQFPPYKQVVPKQAKREVVMNRVEILQALRRVSVLSSDYSRGVRFIFSPKNLEVSSSNPDFGEAREDMTIEYKGEVFEIGFNAKYFMDVLNIIDDENAQFHMGDDTTPCVLKSNDDKGFTHIIMPMRL
ncbi:MAG: DNA polymerase III subunit beta [Pseudomonadota bacterium]